MQGAPWSGEAQLVSHRLEDICDVCDRVVVLKGGRKVGDRAIADISREELRRMIVEGVSG